MYYFHFTERIFDYRVLFFIPDIFSNRTNHRTDLCIRVQKNRIKISVSSAWVSFYEVHQERDPCHVEKRKGKVK